MCEGSVDWADARGDRPWHEHDVAVERVDRGRFLGGGDELHVQRVPTNATKPGVREFPRGWVVQSPNDDAGIFPLRGDTHQSRKGVRIEHDIVVEPEHVMGASSKS